MAESTFAMIKADFGSAIRGTGESKRSGMEVARREGGEVEGTLGERAPLVRQEGGWTRYSKPGMLWQSESLFRYAYLEGTLMQAFELSQLLSESTGTNGVRYAEFLRQPSLSVGIYTLAAGSLDPQQPHTEDEIYYVVSGQGAIRVGDETYQVKAGSIVFVAAGEPHRFLNITEQLIILVLFAPAEYTLAAHEEIQGNG